jgi:Domain of unknown function (DUF397)
MSGHSGWRTSSHSLGNGECVEAGNGPGVVAVRDSKDPDGPVLAFPPRAWEAFTGRLLKAVR